VRQGQLLPFIWPRSADGPPRKAATFRLQPRILWGDRTDWRNRRDSNTRSPCEDSAPTRHESPITCPDGARTLGDCSPTDPPAASPQQRWVIVGDHYALLLPPVDRQSEVHQSVEEIVQRAGDKLLRLAPSSPTCRGP